jgi:hypothetical protein
LKTIYFIVSQNLIYLINSFSDFNVVRGKTALRRIDDTQKSKMRLIRRRNKLGKFWVRNDTPT